MLLCNYFYWWEAQTREADRLQGIVWETFLAVGTAVPEGDTCYCLRIKKVVRPQSICFSDNFIHFFLFNARHLHARF